MEFTHRVTALRTRLNHWQRAWGRCQWFNRARPTEESRLNYTVNELVIHSIGHTMQSTLTARGQTVVPAAIRNQFHLGPSDRLEWVLDNGSIRVVPVRANPIEAFRGQGKGGASARLVAARKQDLTRE